ncbi:hypothetical protein F4860DRAFT_475342 [Xylaria cubensis]|nr:hypothetical protein F4860DRAFT_475342 [Xylaria cubensis]
MYVHVCVCMVIVCMAGMYLHVMQPSGRRRIGGTYSTCMQAHNWPACGTCGWAVRRRAEYHDHDHDPCWPSSLLLFPRRYRPHTVSLPRLQALPNLPP